jgi:hypothetical protein
MLVEGGYDIRTGHKLPANSDVSTTMINTQEMNKYVRCVTNPLEMS